jgi:hypothetical protein
MQSWFRSLVLNKLNLSLLSETETACVVAPFTALSLPAHWLFVVKYSNLENVIGKRGCLYWVHPDASKCISWGNSCIRITACLNCVLANLGCTRLYYFIG